MTLADTLVQYYWLNGDGDSFYLSPDTSNQRYLIAVEGLGMPPIERYTSNRPYRHGQRRRGSHYLARPVDLVLGFRVASRTALWSAMGDWASAFNMEKGTGTLRMVLQDGTERRIDAEVSDQISIGTSGRRGLAQVLAIALTADDPFLYDPTAKTATGSFNGASSVDISCVNSGDMNVWPTITVPGEVVNPTIELVGSSRSLSFTYTVAAGNTMTIDCGAGTIQLQDGTNLMDKVPKTADFMLLGTGAQTVRISAVSGTSLATVTWTERFLSLHS